MRRRRGRSPSSSARPTSRNLVRVFFLQERLKGQGGADVPKSATVHVVGAGVMGGDIAAWCALRGHSVTLQDRGAEFVQPALARAREYFEKRARRPGEADETMARLTADVEGHGVDGRRRRDRGDLRGRRRQARAVRTGRAPTQGQRDTRQQYLQHRARDAGHGTRRSRPARRPAFLQSGGADAAGGGHRGREHAARPCRTPRSPLRAASTSCPCPAAARRDSSSIAFSCRTCTEAMLAAREGVALAVDRSRRRGLRHADGPDRAGRHRRARRVPARRPHPRRRRSVVLRRSRSRRWSRRASSVARAARDSTSGAMARP